MPASVSSVWPLPFGDVPSLDLNAEMASIALVRLEPGRTPRLELSEDSVVEPHIERRGERVVVQLSPREHNPFAWFRFGRRAHATLFVPDDLDAKIYTAAGRLRAEGLEVHQLELVSEAGAIDVREVKGRLRMSTQAGAIRGDRLAGAIDAETQAGAINLGIEALSLGEHRAHSQIGAVRVELVRGLAVRIEAETQLGKARVRYPSQPDAPAVLRLSTEMGAVEVRERAGESPWLTVEPAPESAPAREACEPGLGAQMPRPELRKVLDLVAAGKLTAQDAEELLRAMERPHVL